MKGVCGLGNIGNSCYINSALQILTHIPELNDYLLRVEKLVNIPDSIITFEWIQLYKMIQENHCSISPNRFLDRMKKIAQQKNRSEFASFEQNDAVDYFAFMIDCIHNSLNQVYPDANHDMDLAPILVNYLQTVESKDSSMVQKLFLSCTLNQYVDPGTQQIQLSKIEHESIVALSIPETSPVSLYDCLIETYKEEEMKGDNAWYDEKSQQKKSVLKRSAFCFTPPILVLHLKRWRPNLSKNNVFIDTPLTMDLQRFTVYPESCNYELFGIINHEGSNHMGHYYSYIKKNEEWYSINDHFIQSVTPEQLIHPNNYCLFYRKIK